MSNVRAKQLASSAAQFNIYSSCYGDFFLLRTPISLNGRPAVIKEVNGEPMLRVSGISVKLSAILKHAVAPVLKNHGVCSVNNFYYEQVALFSANFQSKASLKQFLTDKEAAQKEVSLAIANLFKEEAKSSKQPQSSQSPSMDQEQFQVTVDMKVYLVSSAAVGCLPKVNQVNLANHSLMIETWKRSKLFDFTMAMFTGKPTAGTIKRRAQTLMSTTSGSTAEATSCPQNQENKKHNATPTNKSGEHAELAALQVELRGVIEWFSLGVQLKIPTVDLQTIRKDHHFTYVCRLEMLIRWEQLEKPTWTKLVPALVNIGRRDLAEKISKKYGVQLLATMRPHVQVDKNVVSGDCLHASDPQYSGESLSHLEDEVERATQSRDETSKELETDIGTTVPELQMKVSSLSKEVRLLKTKLRNREEENQMLDEAKQSLNLKWNRTIQRTCSENDEAMKELREEIRQKEDELAQTKAQLEDKEKELSEKMKELDAKSARVVELQEQLEKLRRKFNNQQEEMDQKLIESEALAQSHEKYLEELQIQRDVAMNEASKTKEKMQSFGQELADKEEQISRLSEKIAEQERQMAKLREEILSHQRTSEQLSAERMKEDDEREQQLLDLMMSAMKHQLELRKTKDKKNQDKMNLEGAKKTVEKYEKIIELTNHRQMANGEDQRSTVPEVNSVHVEEEKSLLERHPSDHLPSGQNEDPEVDFDPSDVNLISRSICSAPYKLVRYVDAAVGGRTVYFRYYRPSSVGFTTIYAHNSINDTWRQLPDAPSVDCSIIVIDGRLTTVGGERNGKATNQLFSIIADNKRWEKRWEERLPPLPAIFLGGIKRVVNCGTHLIVAGAVTPVIQVLNIDSKSREWSRVSNQPHVHPYLPLLHSLVCSGDYLYLVYDDNRVFRCVISDLIQSTPSNETVIWTIEQPNAFTDATYVAYHGCLISVGGRDSQDQPTSDIRLYIPATKEWSVIGHMTIARSHCFAAVLADDILYIAGGCTTGLRIINEVEFLNIIIIL